jgi:DNA-binding NarL/FixJ family response regulator
LLVDANPTFLRIAAQLLRERHSSELHVIGSSSSCTDALKQAHVLRPQLMLLGISQDSLAYLQLIPRVREVLPNIGIIVLGALDISAYQQAARRAGADGFVAKVALNTMLRPTLQRVIGTTATSGTRTRMLGTIADHGLSGDDIQIGP